MLTSEDLGEGKCQLFVLFIVIFVVSPKSSKANWKVKELCVDPGPGQASQEKRSSPTPTGWALRPIPMPMCVVGPIGPEAW